LSQCGNRLRRRGGGENLKLLQGFTLSEVLITLGIIGIVAAITLPSLIQKIDDRQNIAKWKKEFSVINNAFNEILNEDVQICMYYTQYGACTYGDDGYNEFSKEFMLKMREKLNVVDYCTVSNAISDKVCDYYNSSWYEKNAKYKWAGFANIYSRYKALGGTQVDSSYSPYGINAYNFDKYAYLLNDGAAVYFGGLWNGPWIVVDVNNFRKGPNEIGRDVFVIKAYSNLREKQHWLKPAGADGTPEWNNPVSGSSGCSKDIGLKTTNTVYDAAGAGCSAKYLLGK
jgi:prepilin-type N-terminal cleavage/methylation domain-containing protein